MGRKRKSRLDLPERVYVKDSHYRFHPKDGKPINLDSSFAEAMAKWAKLTEQDAQPIFTMGDAFDRYMREVAPKKAPRTYADNLGEMRYLRPAFAHLAPAQVTPQLVYRYMDARGAVVRGNREKALLSHVMSYCVLWGLIPANPLYGMRRDLIDHGERPRDRLVTDEDLAFFLADASELVRCYVGVKELTGLRKGDLLMLTVGDLAEQGIMVMPRKGRRRDPRTGERVGKRRLIRWTQELLRAVENALTLRKKQLRRAARVAPYIFVTRDGKGYYDPERARADGFDAIWKRQMAKARARAAAAGREFQAFTEHDIRAKAGTDAEAAGQAGHKLLGNTEQLFRSTYNRGVEVVEPLHRRKST